MYSHCVVFSYYEPLQRERNVHNFIHHVEIKFIFTFDLSLQYTKCNLTLHSGIQYKVSDVGIPVLHAQGRQDTAESEVAIIC